MLRFPMSGRSNRRARDSSWLMMISRSAGEVDVVLNGVRAGSVSADGGECGVLNVLAGHAAMADDQRGAQQGGRAVGEEAELINGSP